MNLKQLEYFVRVAELGSFTKAAAVLSMAQPSLSKQIRMLEEDLRQSLLARNGRGIAVTEAGQLLVSRAKSILEQVQSLRREITEISESPTGKVTVGIPTPTGKRVVASLVKAFDKQFPRASLEIVEATAATAYQRILNGTMDMGIVFDPHSSPMLNFTPVSKKAVYLVSPAGNKVIQKSQQITLKDVCALPLMLPNYPHKMRWLVESVAAKAGIQLHITKHIEGVAFLLELVHRGHGFTLLTRELIEESNLRDALQLNLVVKPRVFRTLALAVSSQRESTHLVHETFELIRHYLVLDSNRVRS